MIYLEDILHNSKHPLRANASTRDFWSLPDELKKTASIRTTAAAIVDEILQNEEGEWVYRTYRQFSDTYYDTPVPKERCLYKYYYWDGNK